MQRLLLVIVAFVFAAMTAANARFLEKPEPVRAVEAGIFYGYGVGFPLHGNSSDGACTFGLEMRGNLKDTPWDVGGFFRFDRVGYHFNGDWNDEQVNELLGLGICSHYNFRQGRKVNPFAGLGVGACIYSSGGCGNIEPYPSDGVSIAFFPRVGVEFFSFFRFGAYGTFLRSGYNTVGMFFCITIGGWKKKK